MGRGPVPGQRIRKKKEEESRRWDSRSLSFVCFFFAHHETEKETDGGTHLSYGTVEAQHFVFGSILWCSFERKKNK